MRRSLAWALGPLAALFFALVSVAFVALVARPARAHDFEPGVLSLVEVDAPSRRFDVRWTEPTESTARGEPLRPVYPNGCREEGRSLVCAAGLRGTLGVAGAMTTTTKVVVSVRWRSGRSFEAMLDRDHREVEVSASASPPSFVRIGVEHVATGLDHIAFVVGLFLVVGPRGRRLLATVTAFTLAHSLTLALAALHVVSLPRAPVEATIAASVLLVALESRTERPTLTRRWPWAVAFLFGLVHGLGFAGALEELGLAEQSVLPALIGFNVGVEIAQVMLVALLVLLARFADARARAVASYAIGALGVYWLFDRVAAIFAS